MLQSDETHPVVATLHEFLRTAMRPRTALAKAIVVMLGVKLAFLLAMAAFLALGESRPVVDGVTMARLIGPAPSQAH